jgi:hypothetical protein
MGYNFFVQICARNSRGHRQETEFIDWLNGEINRLLEKSTFDLTPFRLSPQKEWRDIVANANSNELDAILEDIENYFRDAISSVGECIASVDYDHEGMAHSGSNSVFELCGIYVLEGSDYSEGPSEDKDELLDYLNTSDPDHDVFWSEYAD